MRIFFIVMLVLLFFTTQTVADELDSCPVIVNQALASLDETCQALDRNSACYGSSYVAASFVSATDVTAFTAPADRVELKKLRSIQTSGLDEASGRWGLAMLNVQANIPNTLPGQGVIFVLMGDASIENQVASATEVTELVSITTSAAANIRSQPNKRASVVRSVPAGTVLQADVLSPNGKWVRVVIDGLPAWMHNTTVKDFDQLAHLPRPEATSMSPMQAFQFTGGIGENQCQQAQGSLLIQGPNNMIVDIEVNGAKISIGSTIVLNKTPNNELQVAVLSGVVNVAGVAVPAGYFTKASLDSNNRVTGSFAPANPIPSDQVDWLRTFSTSLPVEVLHYVPRFSVAEGVNQVIQPPVQHQDNNSGKDNKKPKEKGSKKKGHDHHGPDHPGHGKGHNHD